MISNYIVSYCNRAKHINFICQKNNFFTGTSNFSNGYFGQGTGPIYLRSVACDGTERTMLECAHDPIGEIDACTHADDAGVSCRNRMSSLKVDFKS